MSKKLKVYVVAGKNLAPKNKGTSSPYCEVSRGRTRRHELSGSGALESSGWRLASEKKKKKKKKKKGKKRKPSDVFPLGR